MCTLAPRGFFLSMGQLNHLPEIQENIMGGGVAIDHRLVGGIATPLKNMKVSWMILPNV